MNGFNIININNTTFEFKKCHEYKIYNTALLKKYRSNKLQFEILGGLPLLYTKLCDVIVHC